MTNRKYSLIQVENGPSEIVILEGFFEDVKFIFGNVIFDDVLKFEFEILDSAGHLNISENTKFKDLIFTILLELVEQNLRFKYGLTK